jgi:photosystem II stability/assembly factor-like uncharacterized protein
VRPLRSWLLLVLLAFGAAGFASAAGAPSTLYGALTFRNIGPTTGRIDAVAGVPGNPLVYFAGGVGGLWRTADGGVVWKPVFDDKAVTSIGAIAVAPSDPRTIYVGTGEPNVRNDIAFGNGVWRSEDGGRTWQHRGLEGASQIAQIAIDARNPRLAYVAAVGDPFKPGAARGIFQTTDGGAAWRRVLYGGEQTGASSIVIAPANPRLLFAGLWTVQRRPWMLTSGGSEDGLYRSSDGGANWTRVRGNGFPDGLTGRIGLAFAPSKPNRLYALVESQRGVLWRSDDAGVHWKLVSGDHRLTQRPFYFSQLAVDPKNADHVFFLSRFATQSFDGGETVKVLNSGAYDHHQAWIDPVGGKRILLGTDAGARLSLDGGGSWRDPQLILAQAYHISTDDETPYFVCGEFQDPGAACGPSLSFSGAITPYEWFTPDSGESGWIVFAPNDHNVIYGTGYTEYVVRFDRRSMQGRVISPWPDDYSGASASAYKYRAAWVAPVAVSQLEPSVLYYGANVLLKTADGGQTWAEISPDLTRNDRSKQQSSGRPVTPDNAGTEIYDTISSIAESPISKGELWIGTDDGKVWLTRDGGAQWHDLTAAIVGLPQWARVDYVDPSPFDDGTAYAAVDAHKLGDRTPYLYVTRDFGAHWTSVASNLPRDSYARMIRQDPVRRGMLYAGTETGLWISLDAGASWQSFQNNLPHAPIYDFVVQRHFNDLVVGTHGRGVWILDDLSPLQQLTADVAARSAYLFPLRDTYRWSAGLGNWGSTDGAGDNPNPGAIINVYLREAPKSKSTPVRVEILDGTTIVRTLEIPHPVAGINRIYWDLIYETVKPVTGYKANTTGFAAPEVNPGTYTVRLTIAGSPQQQTLRVLADPRSPITVAGIQQQFALVMRLRRAYERTTNEINALLALSEKIAKLPPRATTLPGAAPLLATLTSGADAALDALYDARATTALDTIRSPDRLYERIATLAGLAAASDDPPTAPAIAVASQLEAELTARVVADDPLFGADLQEFNALLVANGFAKITVTRAEDPR